MNPIFSGPRAARQRKKEWTDSPLDPWQADFLSQRNQQGYAWAFELDALIQKLFLRICD
jgi:hypothetical protein